MLFKFLKKLLLFVLTVACLMLIAEAYITMQLIKGKRYYIQADWHDLENHNSDILFVGNSRTWLHVDPIIIQNHYNAKCEIIAQHGQDVHVVWLKFKQYIKSNQPPKEIYLQFDPFFLKPTNNLYGIQSFRTCFFNNRVDLTSLKKYDGYLEYYHFVPLAAIDFELFTKIIFNKTVPHHESYETARGSQKRNRNWEQNWNNPPQKKFNIDETSNYIDSFIVYCKTNDIKLYALYSPQSATSYKKTINVELVENVVKNLEKRYNYPITYLNYNKEELFNDSNLFYEHMHLNKRGVDVFTNHLINDTSTFHRFK